MKNATVREVVGEIGKQSNIDFFYNDNLRELNTIVNVTAENQPVNTVLEGALSQANMTYEEIKDNFVVLMPNLKTEKQQNVVTGTVTSASNGDPLIGVTVVIKGTETGTITNLEGKYSITVNSPDDILVFSYVGMETQEVPVSGKTVIDVSLSESAVGLEEVVAIGYGSVKKSDLTGAVGTVSSSDIVTVQFRSDLTGIAGTGGRCQHCQSQFPAGCRFRYRHPGAEFDQFQQPAAGGYRRGHGGKSQQPQPQ